MEGVFYLYQSAYFDYIESLLASTFFFLANNV